MMRLCSDDCIAVYPDLSRYDKDEWRAVLGKEREAFPDATARVVNVICQGERAATEIIWKATQAKMYSQADFEWSAAGGTYEIPCAFIADMEDDHIKLVKYCWNGQLIERWRCCRCRWPFDRTMRPTLAAALGRRVLRTVPSWRSGPSCRGTT